MSDLKGSPLKSSLADSLHKAGLLSDKQLSELKAENTELEEGEKGGNTPSTNPTETQIIKFGRNFTGLMQSKKYNYEEALVVALMAVEDRPMSKVAIYQSLPAYRLGVAKLMATAEGIKKLMFDIIPPDAK